MFSSERISRKRPLGKNQIRSVSFARSQLEGSCQFMLGPIDKICPSWLPEADCPGSFFSSQLHNSLPPFPSSVCLWLSVWNTLSILCFPQRQRKIDMSLPGRQLKSSLFDFPARNSKPFQQNWKFISGLNWEWFLLDDFSTERFWPALPGLREGGKMVWRQREVGISWII